MDGAGAMARQGREMLRRAVTLVLVETILRVQQVQAAHGGIHLPGPSTWPLLLAASSLISFGGILVWTSTLLVTAVGMVLVFICIVGWGLEPI